MEVEMGVVPKVPNHGNAKSRLHAYAGSWLRWRAAGMVPWTKVTSSRFPDLKQSSPKLSILSRACRLCCSSIAPAAESSTTRLLEHGLVNNHILLSSLL